MTSGFRRTWLVAVLVMAACACGGSLAWAAFSSVTSNNSTLTAAAYSDYQEAVLSDSPVAYWRLGEASGTAADDQTANNNDGTYYGSPALGQAGGLLQDSDTGVLFDGVDDYVNVPDSASLDVGDTFTIEAWVKRSDADAALSIVDKDSHLELWIADDDKLTLRIPSRGDLAESTRKITDTTLWHHVVATKSGSTIRLYLDGADVTGRVSNVTTANNANPLRLGQAPYLKGALDEVALYGTALSPARVAAHFELGRPYHGDVLADGPSAYWRLGEQANRTDLVFDSKGSTAGGYFNAPTRGTAGALLDDANTAATFDGSDDYLQMADAAALDVADTFTLEAWVRRGAVSTADPEVIFHKENNAYILRFLSDNRLQLRKSTAADVVSSTTTVTDTTSWHHIVATKSGATVKLYIDGVDVTGTVANQTFADNALPLWIGKDGPSTPRFTGTIDEPAIYGTALSSAQVRAHYESGRAYRQEVLVDNPTSYWRLAETGEPLEHRGSSSRGLTSAATTIALNRPGEVMTGDVMLAAIQESGGTSGTLTAPTGWTLVGTQALDTLTKTYLYRRTAGSSEPTSYSWTSTNSAKHSGGIVALTGVDVSAPVDAFASTANAASLSVTCPSVTTTGTNRWLVLVPFTHDGTAFTFPAAATERFDVNTGGADNDRTIAAATEPLSAAGATGTRTVTSTNPGGYAAPTSGCMTVAISRARTPLYDLRHANDGTYGGPVSFGAPGALAGDTDPAATFDGSTGVASVPDSASLDLGDGPFSLEAWVKRGTTTADGAILDKGVNAYELAISGGRIVLRKSGVSDIVQSTTTLADTAWHHVVATKSGSSVRLYLDGADVTGTVTNATLANNASALAIADSPAFNGSVDEIAIYPSVLSAARVRDHHATGRG